MLRRARSLERRGEREGARALYAEVLAAYPQNPAAREALERLERRAGGGDADPPAAVMGQLSALQQARRWPVLAAEARRWLGRHPRSAALWNLLGVGCLGLGELAQAQVAFGNAVTLEPGRAVAHSNLGNALQAQGEHARALPCYRRALELEPGQVEAGYNLAAALIALGEFGEAAEWLERVCARQPGLDLAQANLLALRRRMCDWREQQDAPALLARLGLQGAALAPFDFLALEDAPGRQLRRARRYAAHKHPPCPLQDFPAARQEGRLRVGYFSADFHDHATLHLMAGLFEQHDRAGFEVHAYSYGPDAPSAARERLKRAVEHFWDVRTLADAEVAALARGHGLDIAVDLKGYTTHGRSGILALRPAPVQVHYLGYPGSLGAPFIDYLICDPVVVPEDQREHYSEALLYLPHSYMVNDDRRPIAPGPVSRGEHGLPEQAFVFCCFNASQKIGPAEFDIWMRLLGELEGSVLWLLGSNRWAEERLREEAQARGVAPRRLVFARRCPVEQHLARHVLADLALDTFAYNAHTTASDALWAGLPMLTLAGRQFAARVGASLLRAVGLPELITETAQDYEALALALARDRERLGSLRARLQRNRITEPLFRTEAFTRTLEQAYREVHARHRAGLPPVTLELAATT